MAQLFVSGMAHFFVVVSGSKIHERVAHFFIDIYKLSYLSFNRHQSELLFKVISDRSEKSSTIVTTNLPFSKWTDLFENTTMVAALIDRLTFHSHVLNMNGDSYRLKATMQDRN